MRRRQEDVSRNREGEEEDEEEEEVEQGEAGGSEGLWAGEAGVKYELFSHELTLPHSVVPDSSCTLPHNKGSTYDR